MRTNPEVASNAEAISNFMEMQPSANRTRQALPASEAIRQWTAEIQIELVSAVRDQASAWHRGTRGGTRRESYHLVLGAIHGRVYVLHSLGIFYRAPTQWWRGSRSFAVANAGRVDRSAAASPRMRRGLFKRQQAR
jgi:hypothetical protein